MYEGVNQESVMAKSKGRPVRASWSCGSPIPCPVPRSQGVQIRLIGEDEGAVQAARQILANVQGVAFTGETGMRGPGKRAYGVIVPTVDWEAHEDAMLAEIL